MALAATVAGFGLLSPLAHWAINPVDLPAPLPDQNQDAESLVFLLSFAVLLPLAAFLTPPWLDRISRRHGPGTATALSLLLGIELCALVAAVKLAGHVLFDTRLGLLLVASALWWVIAVCAIAVSLRRETMPRALARMAPSLWPALAVALGVVLLSFVDLGSISLAPLAVGLAIAAAAGWLVAYRPAMPSLPRSLSWGADAAAIVLITLAVPNLSVFSPGGPSGPFKTQIIQFHQDFYLGPANSLLGGGTMLVDVFSQYGVGSILFLAGVFKLVPIAYGTLALTEGVLAAGTFCLAYVTLRLAGVGLALAWAVFVVAMVVLVFNLVYPLGGLLQHGAFRFGLPIVIVAASAGEARAGRAQPALRGIQAATVGVASLWSFEALLYSLGAIAGITAFRVATASGGRLGIVARLSLQVLGSILVVQLAFAGATLAASGELPEWGKYLTTLREFLTGPVGDLTYDFSPWSPGLAIGGVYAASALALVMVIRREPEMTRVNRAALLVLSGTTGYGIALFSYLVNRSADHIIPYVSLPAVMVVGLWLSILLRDRRLSRAGRGLAVGSVAAAAALLVAVAWSNAGLRFSQSPLAYLPPGGKSFRSAIDTLSHGPELSPGVADATRMLDTYMPGEHKSVVLTSADLSVEALMRTHRVNQIPLSDPWEDSLVPSLHEQAVESAVAALRPGRQMLIDHSSRVVLANPPGSSVRFSVPIASLEVLALRRIAERFSLERLAIAPSGVEVVELRPR
jgi:hypothetical protein